MALTWKLKALREHKDAGGNVTGVRVAVQVTDPDVALDATFQHLFTPAQVAAWKGASTITQQQQALAFLGAMAQEEAARRGPQPANPAPRDYTEGELAALQP